jgi:hypothetical protein
MCFFVSVCSETRSLERETHVPRHPLLVLGYTGRVELVSVFVGVSEACMLLVPCVAAALDAPFISSFGNIPSFVVTLFMIFSDTY